MSDDITPDKNSRFLPSPGEESGSHLNRMMTGHFLEYASYVIRDRAIPDVDDGLKPVQRRILHTLFRADDGKFHKVANMVGACMAFHPHGDTSIYGALVTLANKDFFLEKQGNFGNIVTGDAASAARYIETRLTPLAREVLFNPELTVYTDSYDGRNQEPVAIPAKVPALLMMGADGIAVGMATRILPHNFGELIDAQIDILRGRRFTLVPDFITGGLMDASLYDLGRGKVSVRAKIDKINDKTIVIREVPPGVTTESLIASIEEAERNGKIKIAAINDYTTESAEIELQLPRGVEAAWAIEALYAFTDCQVSLSPNMVVIRDNQPVEMHVGEVLHHNTQRLVDNLRRELEIEINKLDERWHGKSLERLFIENRIYKKIEECRSAAAVLKAVHDGLKPFLPQLRRSVSDEDVDNLLKIPIRRISLFDMERNRAEIADIDIRIAAAQLKLRDMKATTITFLKDIRKRYADKFPRRTQITRINKVDVKHISLANLKVGFDRKTGYLGTGVHGADVLKVSEYDRLVVIMKDGTFKVVPVPDGKVFFGKIEDVFISDKERVYSLVYRDAETGLSWAKRIRIDAFIMDREYRLFPEDCKLELLATNTGIVLDCELEDTLRLRDQVCELTFDDIELSKAGTRGIKISNRPVEKMRMRKRGSDQDVAIAREQEQQRKPRLREQDEDENAEDDEAGLPEGQGWKAPLIRFIPPEGYETPLVLESQNRPAPVEEEAPKRGRRKAVEAEPEPEPEDEAPKRRGRRKNDDGSQPMLF